MKLIITKYLIDPDKGTTISIPKRGQIIKCLAGEYAGSFGILEGVFILVESELNDSDCEDVYFKGYMADSGWFEIENTKEKISYFLDTVPMSWGSVWNIYVTETL